MAITHSLIISELFGGLDSDKLDKISFLCRGLSYKRGMTIFSEGSEATDLYIMTNGRVALEMEVHPVPDRPAIPTAVEVVSKGECFGWSALVEPLVYTLSARCITNCTVLAIRGDMLRRVMNDDPVLGYQVMSQLARVISLRLLQTRLRLTSGIGIIMLRKELEISE